MNRCADYVLASIALVACLGLASMGLYFSEPQAAGGNLSYFGSEDVYCAYPTGTASSAGYTATGAATLHEAVDDVTGGGCFSPTGVDDDTTYITCAAGTATCTVLYNLINPSGLADAGEILAVQSWLRGEMSSSPCSVNGQIELYYRINGSDYLACETTNSRSCVTDWTNYVPCGSTAWNPDTGKPWTVTDISNLQLYLSDIGTASIDHRITAVSVSVSTGSAPTARPTELYEKR